jgi:hypothetical protein
MPLDANRSREIPQLFRGCRQRKLSIGDLPPGRHLIVKPMAETPVRVVDSDQSLCPMYGAGRRASQPACPKCGETAGRTAPTLVKFRWRIIPTFFLGLYASLGILSAISHLCGWITVIALHRTDSEFGKAMSEHGTAVMGLVTSLVWGSAARFWWNGRWWWAVGLTAAGYFAGALCAWLFRL